MLLTNVTGNYFIKQNDTATEIHLAVTEVDGTPVDLSTAPRVEVVIGTILGRTLVKEPTLLSEPGELTFGLDPGDILPVGDNLVEIHIYKENGEKRVAPSKGHYKLRVQQAIDDLEVVVTTVTLDYFLAEVNRITFGLPEAVAEANELIIRSEQLITDAEIVLQQAESARDIAVEAVGVVEPLLDDMRDATSSANIAASLADGIATELLGYNTAITDFSLATTYIKHQTVRANGSTYRAKVETQGNPLPVAPATSNQWFELVAAKGDTGPRGPEGQRGATGATGATGTGLNFLGELDSVDDLPMANNNPGDTYFVGEFIYTWSGSKWVKSEAVKGPQGEPGKSAKVVSLDFIIAANDASQVNGTLITINDYTHDAEADFLQVYRNSRLLYPGEDYELENGSIRLLQDISEPHITTFYILVQRSVGIVDEDTSRATIVSALGFEPAKESESYLAPLHTPKQHIIKNRITAFQSGHGFTKQSATGTQTDNTVDFVLGSQSLQLSTPGTGGTIFTRTLKVTPFDTTNSQLSVTLKVKNVAELQSIQIYLFTGGNTNDYFVLSPIQAPAIRSWLNDDEWATVTLNFATATSFGNAVRNNVTGLQLRVIDKGNGIPVHTYWNGISLIDAPAQGVVSITMDDGWLTQYTEARRIMDMYGFPATAYIIADVIGTDNSKWLTMDHLRKLRDVNGWEIAAHAGTMRAHEAKFHTLSDEELIKDMKIMRNWLISNGFQSGTEHLAFPGGAYNAQTLEVMRKFYSTSRTISESNHETYPPADPHRLRIVNVFNDVSIERFKTHVDRCFEHGTWLILCYHQFTDPATVATQVTPANFQAQMDYIASKGIPVRNVGDVIRYGI